MKKFNEVLFSTFINKTIKIRHCREGVYPLEDNIHQQVLAKDNICHYWLNHHQPRKCSPITKIATMVKFSCV